MKKQVIFFLTLILTTITAHTQPVSLTYAFLTRTPAGQITTIPPGQPITTLL